MIGLDLGTTSCKAVVFDAAARPVASASERYPLLVPHPGWAEQDVPAIGAAVMRALRAAAASSPVAPTGISFSGAMHSCFPVAADGTPLAHSMTWADNRAAPYEATVRAEVDVPALYARTGCPVRSTYHPARLRWWVEAAPDVAARAGLFAGIKDWVLHELTGVWATDFGLASTTGLLDSARRAWDPQALAAAQVPAERLPPLVASETVVGGLTREAAAATGLPSGLPVVAGGSDGAMANLGTGLERPGQTVITVGTSGAVRQLAGRPWIDPDERTWSYLAERDLWLIGGAVNNGGLALDWVRATLYSELDGAAGFQRLAEDAASIPAGAAGVFFLPYLAGERSPSWTPDDPAMVCGLRLGHGRGHLARAAMEGVAHCLADVRDALPAAAPDAGPAFLTGGITRTPLWAQIVADVIGEPLVAIEAADASATGAALVGMRALGRLPSSGGAGTVAGEGAASSATSRGGPAGATPGPTYTPGSDRDFYVRHRRAYNALRRLMRQQAAASSISD
jgi:gluconokinase